MPGQIIHFIKLELPTLGNYFSGWKMDLDFFIQKLKKNMQTKHEAPTSKNEQTEGQPPSDLQQQIESTSKIQNGNIPTDIPKNADGTEVYKPAYEWLKSNIGRDDFGRGDLNEPYVPLTGIIEKSGLKLQYALVLLQYHGYRDCDGNWSEQMLSTGYVVLSSYVAKEVSRHIETRYKKELLSPEAQELFLAFFAEETL